MKEITRIHLAKTPYDIEIDAKKELEKYLSAIEKAMKSEEAMFEIELRMVELLGERGVAKGGVVAAGDVKSLRQQMGEPKEFSEDGEAVETSDAPQPADRPVKRLMRDPDQAIFGGVCAGIAAYWGINPLWIRILFIISPFISFGTSLLIYIVMWISLPEAKTAADKLQMRGEEVTLDSLKNFSVSDEMAGRAKSTAMKVLQIFVSFVLFMMTLGMLIALMMGIVAGVIAIPMLNGFAAQPWAWGAFAALIVLGAVGVTLSGLLTSSAIRWKFGRSTLIALITASIIGALVVPVVVVTSMQTAIQLKNDEARLAKTEVIELPEDLDGVKYFRTEGLPSERTENRAGEGKIRAKLKYLAIDGKEKPEISVEKQGDTLVVKSQKTCQGRSNLFLLSAQSHCILERGYVKFYGPIQPADRERWGGATDYYIDD